MTLNGPGLCSLRNGTKFAVIAPDCSDAVPHGLGVHLELHHLSVRQRLLDDRIVLDEALDGVTEVGLPGVAPKLAVAQNGHPDLLLTLERLHDRAVFGLAESVAAEPGPGSKRGACPLELLRAASGCQRGRRGRARPWRDCHQQVATRQLSHGGDMLRPGHAHTSNADSRWIEPSRFFIRVAAEAPSFCPPYWRRAPRRQPRAAPGRHAGAAAAAKAASVLPTYIPLQGGPSPIPSGPGRSTKTAGTTIPPAHQGLDQGAAGNGSTINVAEQRLTTRRHAVDQNPAWQEVNKRLNANVQFNIVAPADYPAKLATTMAGNDLPTSCCSPAAEVTSARRYRQPAAVLAEQVRRPDAVPGRRCHQGVPVSGGHPHLRLAELGLRARRPAVHGAAAALRGRADASSRTPKSTTRRSARTTSRRTPTTSRGSSSS